jgi:hypothetical protein
MPFDLPRGAQNCKIAGGGKWFLSAVRNRVGECLVFARARLRHLSHLPAALVGEKDKMQGERPFPSKDS